MTSKQIRKAAREQIPVMGRRPKLDYEQALAVRVGQLIVVNGFDRGDGFAGKVAVVRKIVHWPTIREVHVYAVTWGGVGLWLRNAEFCLREVRDGSIAGRIGEAVVSEHSEIQSRPVWAA